MSLINKNGAVPSIEKGKTFLSNRACFLKLFDGYPNLCFDNLLKDNLDRFVREYSKLQINGYKVLRFTISPSDNLILSKILINLAKFVYNDGHLRSLVKKLKPNNEHKAYDVYTDYFERLSQKNPILIVISNFYEEIDHISDDELNLFNQMMERCNNVRMWICGEDKMNENRHSAYYEFYKLFDPIPTSFFESLQNGAPLPYVYFSYNWGAKSDNTVDKLCEKVKSCRIPHQRDKENCGYRSDIHAFMNQIRSGHYVVVLLSEDYLRSFYCLYELTGLLNHHDYEQRIYPILVDRSIREDAFHKSLEDFWKDKLKDKAYQDTLQDSTVGRFTRKRKVELMNEYIKKLPVIYDYIARIGASTLNDMEAQDFAPLLDQLSRSISVRI